jgi:hypothetical protein
MTRDVEQLLDRKDVVCRDPLPVPHCLAVNSAGFGDAWCGAAHVTHHTQDRIAPFVRPRLLSFHRGVSSYVETRSLVTVVRSRQLRLVESGR